MQEGSRHGAKAKAGRQGMARQKKAVVSKRPVVKLTGTGLVAKQPADEVGRPLALFKEVGGGNAVVLATRKADSDLPYCLPPNLSPLPVSVHTHSLNLQKPI